MKKQIREITKAGIKFQSIILLIAAIFMMYYNLFLGAIILILIILNTYISWYFNQKRANDVTKYIEKLGERLEKINHNSILEMPIALAIIDENEKISWYNQEMKSIFDEQNPMNEYISDVLIGINIEKIESCGFQEVKNSDKYYNVKSLKFEDTDSKSGTIRALFFTDITEYKKYKLDTDEKISVVCHIQIDNFDDLINETKEQKRPFVTSEINKRISLWASRINAILKKYEKDKYLVVFEKKYLDNIALNRFSILDEIRDIDEGNNIPPTISIGVTADGNSPSKKEENALSALELALGRGGDQAVLRTTNDYEFYGGRTKAVEKRNKVKARIIAQAFVPILDESEKVFIMGHQYPDMDAIGSAIGIYRAAANRGKEAYIIFKEPNESIKLIYDKFKDDPMYKFITPEEAIETFDIKKDLLVVVDTSKPSMTEAPELVEVAERIVLFDHHRRGKEFIEKTLLTYLEPYASSASELVTEVLQYMERKINIEKKEAEALLAGIIVDTKNFSQQTGVRTFEAAAFLRKYDADTIDVKQLFQDDLNTYINRAEYVKNAKIIREDIAISKGYESLKNARLIIAQAADQLLNIRGIKNAFVIGKEENEVYVSGRSLGDISVQLILEKIGGGGHMNVAGAKFDIAEHSIGDVERMLLEAIDEYFKEIE